MTKVNNKPNIVLIGYMGSGKSSVGKRLADEVGYKFIDTDSLVEIKKKKSIRDIFESEGEQAFRQVEAQVVTEVSQKEKVVISCGGGVVLNPENIKALKRKGSIFYLRAGIDTLFNRAKRVGVRPLLMVDNPEKEFKKIFSQRKKAYIDAADTIIEVNDYNEDEVVARIIKRLGV